jgi:tRNA dimethylallyltransferase
VAPRKQLFVIAGPTASGKSQLALNLSCEVGGEIINADAIQIYNEIPILSCAPSEYDKSLIKHHLYNYITVTDDYSVGRYIKDAIATIHNITARDKIPILVGGTGMYIKSLCHGMHNIPDIDPEIREKSRDKFQALGNEKFYAELQRLDPVGAEKLHASNSQRIIRFYEIFMQTGRSIVEFYMDKPSLFLEDYDIKTIVLETDRMVLYDRCNARFVSMVENGAIQEVEHIRVLYSGKTAAEKAIGFNELVLYLDGAITKDEAITLAQARTRQYAKRQMTWFRHQIDDATPISFDSSISSIDDILKTI